MLDVIVSICVDEYCENHAKGMHYSKINTFDSDLPLCFGVNYMALPVTARTVQAAI